MSRRQQMARRVSVELVRRLPLYAGARTDEIRIRARRYCIGEKSRVPTMYRSIPRGGRMATEYMQATTEQARRALAYKIADLRHAGVPWDGPGGIVARRLVSGARRGESCCVTSDSTLDMAAQLRSSRPTTGTRSTRRPASPWGGAIQTSAEGVETSAMLFRLAGRGSQPGGEPGSMQGSSAGRRQPASTGGSRTSWG
jgi:hypothetical protein